MHPSIILKPGREKALNRRHPWIFSMAIKKVSGKPELGETVDILDHNGNWLARGAYSPQSQIRVRIWSFDQQQNIDQAFFTARVEQAFLSRQALIKEQGLTGFRLIAAESDYLPGVTVDHYDNTLVCQLLSAGAEYNRHLIIAALEAVFPQHTIYDRSDVDVRKKEGLAKTQGEIKGVLEGGLSIIEENGVKILVDIKQGHKTGFYFDQRDNRRIAGEFCKDKTVLNCFSYTGTFGIYALNNGAKHFTNVDLSQPALDIAKQNIELNNLDLSRVDFVQADVFKLLRKYREEGRTFDVIILDPPKFADNKAQLTGACRGYKDINMVAMQLLNPGGTLLTYSCSGLMSADLFQKIVADAALDARRDAQIIARLSQASDHPIASTFPEGFYLKGLALTVL
ncbi:class I SAM-dependent methyltransferase [Psychrobium sp. 1_MG-2023]|uniref:class I SAM-dependent methyltransferase n=1 Tax=Psychrobium sp. 1_MG-2023 TaxID=3062624 RepID=UPI000C3431AD|nr:class I SAM-dependent methyltransferase [Psychrobium sp. 1_MG-2023]MDP2560325.1 class I SAM-dependent methyltransferase [Psychrobium sp. 1_MG-2023]PKF55437.1 23S rRNA (cytosine(1962)-C(5))-methyltransferase RlmI [Alteromonadales bacterium alter-6D02]